jgi:2-dehydro-3-deoxygluconokinase
MVELSSAGEGGLMRLSFAGDVLNTLWYAQMGFAQFNQDWNAGFLSAVGSDPLSDQMLAFLAKAKLDTSDVRRIHDRRPGLYMIHLDGAERSFSYWRDTSAAKLLAADADHLGRAIDKAGALYFSGITLAILSKQDRETMLACLKAAVAAGKPVAFDPNIRPALWANAPEMREAITQAAGCATLVLPSFDDEANNFGDKDPEATALRYQAAGCDVVVVKNGAEDVLIADGNVRTTLETPPVHRPVDTTGAGDSFNGAFLADYLEQLDLVSAVRAAQSCSAKVICHYGALMPMAE